MPNIFLTHDSPFLMSIHLRYLKSSFSIVIEILADLSNVLQSISGEYLLGSATR
jgi:hypothetical protein